MSALWDEKLEGMDTAEVHWGAGTILAIFFASSLVSAVFFGLGYSFGRGGTAKPAINMALSHTETPALVASSTLASPTKSSEKTIVPVLHAAATTITDQSAEHADARPITLQPEVIEARKVTTAVPVKSAKPVAVAHEKTAAMSASHYMVQVGAIGDHKDAQNLVTQLRKKGFHAGIYPAKHDKFLHVQIGPFATEGQAQTMRHRVMQSGFHAILKQQS